MKTTPLTSSVRPTPAGTPVAFSVERWTWLSKTSVSALLVGQILLALAPLMLDAGSIDRLTTLYIYGILALMWNALAGYAGLVSVGHQAFFGLGAYAAVRIADAGMPPYLAMFVAAVVVALVAVPLSSFMLRLKGGEFAIGMWVVAALCHLLVNLDNLVQGETGTSLISLQQVPMETRRLTTYWFALFAMAGLAWCVFGLLRSKVGSALQAIRDSQEAAASIGIQVLPTKTYFSVQWTAYMLFMVLVGGIGTYEGPIIGAIVFFAVETAFGAAGVTYLIGLGLVAVLFALLLPKGIWGTIESRWGLQLLPVGYRLRVDTAATPR